jgi:hypothetical protein
VTVSLTIDGVAVPVRLKRSAVARRLSLRVDPLDRSVVLVLPPHVSERRGMAFVRERTDWLRTHLAALPARIPFAAGVVLPLLGVGHELRAVPQARQGVWVEAGCIHVSGRPEFFARRVSDWLRRRAMAEFAGRTPPLATRINRAVGKLSVRDPRSRWGSCSSRGDLTFSWRLILAPETVLDYVVAHEVAHLVEMNHSPAFWRLVATLAPEYGAARLWLKRLGSELHRYG